MLWSWLISAPILKRNAWEVWGGCLLSSMQPPKPKENKGKKTKEGKWWKTYLPHCCQVVPIDLAQLTRHLAVIAVTFAALLLPRMVERYKNKGYEFVPIPLYAKRVKTWPSLHIMGFDSLDFSARYKCRYRNCEDARGRWWLMMTAQGWWGHRQALGVTSEARYLNLFLFPKFFGLGNAPQPIQAAGCWFQLSFGTLGVSFQDCFPYIYRICTSFSLNSTIHDCITVGTINIQLIVLFAYSNPKNIIIFSWFTLILWLERGSVLSLSLVLHFSCLKFSTLDWFFFLEQS